MTPPGLAARLRLGGAPGQRARSASPRYYFEWERPAQGQEKLDAAFTPAVSLVAGWTSRSG